MGAEPCGSALLGRARCPRRVGLGRTPPRRVGLGCTGPPPRVTPLLLCLFMLGWVETLVLHLFNPPPPPLHVGLGLHPLFVLGWVAPLLLRLVVLAWVRFVDVGPPFVVPGLSPLSSTFLALTVTVCVLVDRRGRGGCRCSHVCEPSCLRVYRRWALLFVSGPTDPA